MEVINLMTLHYITEDARWHHMPSCARMITVHTKYLINNTKYCKSLRKNPSNTICVYMCDN